MSTFRGNILSPSSALKMETMCSSETLISTYVTTRRQNPKQDQHQIHGRVKTSNFTISMSTVYWTYSCNRSVSLLVWSQKCQMTAYIWDSNMSDNRIIKSALFIFFRDNFYFDCWWIQTVCLVSEIYFGLMTTSETSLCWWWTATW
jgi:hypothetical protein